MSGAIDTRGIEAAEWAAAADAEAPVAGGELVLVAARGGSAAANCAPGALCARA